MPNEIRLLQLYHYHASGVGCTSVQYVRGLIVVLCSSTVRAQCSPTSPVLVVVSNGTMLESLLGCLIRDIDSLSMLIGHRRSRNTVPNWDPEIEDLKEEYRISLFGPLTNCFSPQLDR
jgi:hypothetical protein